MYSSYDFIFGGPHTFALERYLIGGARLVRPYQWYYFYERPTTPYGNRGQVMDTLQNQNEVGVGPTSTGALDPRQELFIRSYFDVNSNTFGNCYQSALTAGYSMETARNLTHNRPKWLSEKLGHMQTLDPELLLMKLASIMADPNEQTHNKLKAIAMLMKHHQMLDKPVHITARFNIQNILD